MNTQRCKLADEISVSLAQVHNVGAGGVLNIGTFNRNLISDKRMRQVLIRRMRACGIRG